MEIVRDSRRMQEISRDFRKEGVSVGFVPTMGAIHDGHLSLVERARRENDRCVVSIFVNPTQFGSNVDFEKYPRDFERDFSKLEGKCDILFCPESNDLYAKRECISFSIKDLASVLCGADRPGHFEGVCQVVTKFLHLVSPRKLYLGQKDYQQVVILRHLVMELFFDVEVIVCPTLREEDGLAMSSRNVFLSSKDRQIASALFQSLQYAKRLLLEHDHALPQLLKNARAFLNERGVESLIYFDVRDASTLDPVSVIRSPVVIAVAAMVGTTRLIDSILFDPYAP